MAPRKKAEQTRERLTRERVLTAAIELADTDGIESLSMRRLGSELGVEAMSLYNHVASKSVLLDAMVDTVFAEIELPEAAAKPEWKQAMRDRAVNMRAVLLRHPWSVPLLQSRSTPGHATLHHHDTVIGILRNAGFSIELAAHAFSAFDSYIIGFVLQEIALPFEAGEPPAELAEAIMAAMPADAYPHLVEMTMGYVMQPGYSYSDEYLYGYALLIDGFDRAL